MPANFHPAVRKQVKLKLGITGPSGSGKTMSALLIAFGIGEKVAVVDTENLSASLYSEMVDGPLAGRTFDTLGIQPPYTMAKYLASIEEAEKAGYDVLIIDSISHAWAGEGGLLSKKEALDQRGGKQNQYTNWASITKEHETFKAKLLSANIHLICTMRSKQDYILETVDGKQVPKKVGMAPIQREGMEYEFTTVFDLGMDHHAMPSKDRTAMWDGQIFLPTVDTGRRFVEWLKAGRPVVNKPAAKDAVNTTKEPDTEGKSPEEVKAEAIAYIVRFVTEAGVPVDAFYRWLFSVQDSKKKKWVVEGEAGLTLADGKVEDLLFLAQKPMLQAAVKAYAGSSPAPAEKGGEE